MSKMEHRDDDEDEDESSEEEEDGPGWPLAYHGQSLVQSLLLALILLLL
jgi:hypothetical protein